MTAPARALLTELSAIGVTARLVGDRLRLEPAPPADLLERCRAAKPEIVALLAPRPETMTGLACREVRGFPARLLAELPMRTSLVLARPDGTTSTLPASSARWSAMHTALPAGSTVGAVLAHHGFALRAVVIHGTH